MALYHFSGIAGQGMNPLAKLMRTWGHEIQGSDRSFDQGKNSDAAAALRAMGISIVPQDGSGVRAGIDRFFFSTAVEQDTPEIKRARDLKIEMVPRPALLAEVVNAGKPGIAIAGTSGKSTVTGMLGWIVRLAKFPATVIGGAALVGEGVAGCFAAGPKGGAVIAEACESDGTLVGYQPSIGLVHNISRDHAEVSHLHKQFGIFAGNCGTLLVNAGCAEAMKLRAAGPSHQRRTFRTYGGAGASDLPLEIVSIGPHRGVAVIGEITVEIPQPGAHNLENAVAATALAIELGIDARAIADALATFPGVARRFEVVGTTESGIRVVDDYAHNAEKIKAAVVAAQSGCERLIAVFQPHGFGPARFLRDELRELMPKILRPQDRFCYAEIFYAGGTVAKDISSRMLAQDAGTAYAANHQEVMAWAAEQAFAGDTVLLMGARDPELSRLARAIFELM
jgi:UDP-N-acetylmuramate--alanine ligase